MHVQGEYSRRDGHLATDRIEHDVDGSAEFQTGFVHRATARPDRTPPVDSGPHLGLIATLRLPWGFPAAVVAALGDPVQSLPKTRTADYVYNCSTNAPFHPPPTTDCLVGGRHPAASGCGPRKAGPVLLPPRTRRHRPESRPPNGRLCSASATRAVRAATPRPHLSQNPVPKSTLHLGAPQRC